MVSQDEELTRRAEPVPGVLLGEPIGRGGFATVYRGIQTSVGRAVAVKIDDRVITDPRDRRRFEREATAAGRLSAHPGIVTLFDAGITADQRPYLVMEFCPRGSLAAVQAGRPMPPTDVAAVGTVLADALAAAHAQGILHRDLKPGNVLLTEFGTPALADFGLAALPRADAEVSVTLEALTPAYAPPEAFRYAAPTPAADIYSLGATLYGLLLGRPPHSDSAGRTPAIPNLLAAHTRPVPDPPGAPCPQLMEVIRRAMAPDPAHRWPSAQAMGLALAALAPGAPARPQWSPPTDAPPPSAPRSAPPQQPTTAAPEQTRAPVRSGSSWVAAVVVLLAAGLGFGTWWLFGRGASTATGVGTSGASASAASGAVAGPSAGASAPVELVGRCYGGLLTMSGIRTATERPCTEPHYWEAFAVGLLGPGTSSVELTQVRADPAVTAACTDAALAAYGAKPGRTYDIEVIPPREVAFAQGQRGFVCVAAVAGAGQVTGSVRS